MLSKHVKAKKAELLDPAGAAWKQAAASTVVLSPTPLEMQPTDYVRVSWTSRPYGKASSIRSARSTTATRSSSGWAGRTTRQTRARRHRPVHRRGSDLVSDSPGRPLIGMGIKGKPVNAWYWRAD
jgi:hypothetical protein